MNSFSTSLCYFLVVANFMLTYSIIFYRKLKHPNILTIFGLVQLGENVGVVMEMARGDLVKFSRNVVYTRSKKQSENCMKVKKSLISNYSLVVHHVLETGVRAKC